MLSFFDEKQFSVWLMVLFTLSLARNCTQPLGMQSRNISDGQISASSERKVYLGPTNARLNFSGTDGRPGAWMPGRNDHNQWLQVDFGNETKVTRIDTQGRRCGNCSHWVKKYNVTYGQDNATFHQYKENGRVKVLYPDRTLASRSSSRVIYLDYFSSFIILKEFLANTDPDSIVRHVLSPPVVARYVRINPTEWSSRIALRVEFRGCRAGTLGLSHALEKGVITSSSLPKLII